MRFKTATIALAAPLLAAAPALAHHPMGGATPETAWHGLLSGIGHPIIGVDHFAFIVLVGLAAAFAGARFITPLAFIAATVAGCLLKVAGIALPLAEFVIAGSVVLTGIMVLSGRNFGATAYGVIFAIAGLFHGWAYGAAIIGAEPTPLAAYLTGFGVTQYAIALAVSWLTLSVWKASDSSAIQPRLAGAVAAGIGAAFLIEGIEGVLFA